MAMEYFGDKLKSLREQRGFTQQDLADKLELSKASISAYEQSSKYPSVDVLINICNVLNTSADFLLGIDQINLSSLTQTQTDLILKLIIELNAKN